MSDRVKRKGDVVVLVGFIKVMQVIINIKGLTNANVSGYLSKDYFDLSRHGKSEKCSASIFAFSNFRKGEIPNLGLFFRNFQLAPLG